MRDWFRLISIGAAVSATLTGCAMQNANVPPAQLMSELQAGQPMLDCRVDCGFAWGGNRQKAAVLDAAGRWQELALLVMQIGYMNDLTYYYLGHAAENLGYLQSAQKYYRIAEKLSVTQMSCHQSEINLENMGIPQNVCGGYVFPDVLYPRLEVVESQLAAFSAPSEPTPTHHLKRRVVRKPSSATAASASGSSQAAGSGFVVPTPTAAPAGGSGFVEPAPAAPSSSDQFAIPPVRH